MRIAKPLFALLKTAWDAAGLASKFPGGYQAGQLIATPSRLPMLQPWPLTEHRTGQSNKGAYWTYQFEVGIVATTFEQSGDEALTEALEAATVGITAQGPVQLTSKIRLITVGRYPDGAKYVEDTKLNLFICNILFTGMASG